MNDLISKRALCDDLREYKVHPVPISSDESEVKGYNDGIDLAISVIAEFPSAQPDAEPVMRGHWTNISISASGRSSAECSVCGCVVHDSFSNVINFCPNCGVKMEKA